MLNNCNFSALILQELGERKNSNFFIIGRNNNQRKRMKKNMLNNCDCSLYLETTNKACNSVRLGRGNNETRNLILKLLFKVILK